MTIGSGVQGYVTAKDGRWTIARIVMGEWADAGPNLAERFHAGSRLARKDIVGAAHRKREPIAFRQHNAGRPYFDVDLVDLVGRELLLLVMSVIRAIWQRELRVEFAVRAAQPALRDRRMGVERALESDLLEVRGKRAHHQEQIGIFCRR